LFSQIDASGNLAKNTGFFDILRPDLRQNNAIQRSDYAILGNYHLMCAILSLSGT
jgi:hypothetical protein